MHTNILRNNISSESVLISQFTNTVFWGVYIAKLSEKAPNIDMMKG
jgi:hypothetical protein